MMKRKAQIYATLTWFVAFLIIFFIMIIFLFFTIVTSINKDIDIEKVKYNSENLESQRFLVSFLNQKIEDKSVKEAAELWADGKQVENFEKVLNEKFAEFSSDYDFKCYIFRIESGGKKIDIKNLAGYGGGDYNPAVQLFFLKSGARLVLLSEKESEAKFYGGDCKYE